MAGIIGSITSMVKDELKKQSSKKSGGGGSVPKTGAEQAEVIRGIEQNFQSGKLTEAQRNASIQDVLDGKSIYDPSASYNSGAGSARPGTSSASSGPKGGTQGSGAYAAGVSSPGASAYYQDFLKLYEQNEREVQAAKEAADRLLNAQKENRLSSINRETADAQQQAYVARMQGEKNLGANLRSQGFTPAGGMAESTGLGVQTNYQNVLADLEKNRLNAANEVNMAYDSQSLQNAIAFADKVLQNNQNRMNTMYNLYRDQVSDSRYQNEWNYQTGRDQLADQRYDSQWAYQQAQDALNNQRYDAEWQYGVSQDQRAAALQRAQTLAAYGNFSGYRALGYTDEQIAAMERGYRQSAAAKSSGGGSKTQEVPGSEQYELSAIIRGAKEAVNRSETQYGGGDYATGARYILDRVADSATYYQAGKAAGIPGSVLDRVYDEAYESAYKAQAGQQEKFAQIAAALASAEDDEDIYDLLREQGITPAEYQQYLASLG